MVCQNCGKEVADGMQFCVYCGAKISPAENRNAPVQKPKKKNKTFESQVPSYEATEDLPEKVERGHSQALRIILLLLLILILAAATALFVKLLLDNGLLALFQEIGRE